MNDLEKVFDIIMMFLFKWWVNWTIPAVLLLTFIWFIYTYDDPSVSNCAHAAEKIELLDRCDTFASCETDMDDIRSRKRYEVILEECAIWEKEQE